MGATHNGHFGCKCFHPIFVCKHIGDCEEARLPSKEVLQWEIDHLMRRPVGRPPKACPS